MRQPVAPLVQVLDACVKPEVTGTGGLGLSTPFCWLLRPQVDGRQALGGGCPSLGDCPALAWREPSLAAKFVLAKCLVAAKLGECPRWLVCPCQVLGSLPSSWWWPAEPSARAYGGFQALSLPSSWWWLPAKRPSLASFPWLPRFALAKLLVAPSLPASFVLAKLLVVWATPLVAATPLLFASPWLNEVFGLLAAASVLGSCHALGWFG